MSTEALRAARNMNSADLGYGHARLQIREQARHDALDHSMKPAYHHHSSRRLGLL